VRFSVIAAATAVFLSSPLHAITLTVDFADVAARPDTWAALGIAPTSTARLSVTFDDTAPALVTTPQPPSVPFANSVYPITAFEFQMGALSIGAPTPGALGIPQASNVVVTDATTGNVLGFQDRFRINIREGALGLPNGGNLSEISTNIWFAGDTVALSPLPSVGDLNRPDHQFDFSLISFIPAGSTQIQSVNLGAGTYTTSVVQIAPVPLPAAGWMLLAGVLGLGAFKARRRHRLAFPNAGTVRGLAMALACLVAMPTASEAITLRADIAGFAQDDADWLALGIAPVDRASLTVTYDETTPAFTVFSDTAGGTVQTASYEIASFNFEMGSLSLSGPVPSGPVAIGNSVFVRDGIRSGTNTAADFFSVAISRRPVTLPGGGALEQISFGLNSAGPGLFSGLQPATAELQSFPSTSRIGVFSFRMPGEQINRALVGRDVTISQVQIAPVPLPAAGWMLLAGVLGLGALKARRKPA
jgi:hypothetical protein